MISLIEKGRKELTGALFLLFMLTKEQILFLKSCYATTSNADLSGMLGISIPMVSRQAGILGLRKDKNYLSDVNGRNGRYGAFVTNMKRWNNH